MRNLVTVRRISDLSPIPNADAIEVATIDGWKVVTGKNQFKTGDSCCYFEVDSFLPIDPRFEFLRKGCFRTDSLGKEGFLLKTIRLRGQVSQGLILPLSDFPELEGKDADFAELLGVTKWDPPIPAELAGEVEGPIPSVIKYTDQERIQNLPHYFSLYEDEEFEGTIKIDGSSATYYILDGHFGVCGHNWEYKESTDNSIWRVARNAKVEEALRAYLSLRGKNIALQGEIYGEGIQKNNEKIHGQDVAIFDIWNIDESRYMTPEERTDALETLWDKGLLLKHVPFLGLFKPFKEHPTMEDLLAFADGPSLNKNSRREGIVYKSSKLFQGQTVSFKTISNKYLLKAGD